MIERAAIALPQVADLETLRERILFDLKLGKQAPGYKTAHKAPRRFFAELSSLEQAVFEFANSISERFSRQNINFKVLGISSCFVAHFMLLFFAIAKLKKIIYIKK